MKALLILTIFIILLLITGTLLLLFKYRRLKKRNLKNNEAEKWKIIAHTDDMTGLLNRMAYNEKVLEIEKKNRTSDYRIILFDIDDFKKTNDTRGHLEGDAVLKYVAKTLKDVFSLPCFEVYRIGGDEFAVIADSISEEDIIYYLLNVRNVLEKNSNIRLSKGYSVIQSDVKTAFKNADEMLYADKNSRK